jgi:hypothetical protein
MLGGAHRKTCAATVAPLFSAGVLLDAQALRARENSARRADLSTAL